MAYSTAGRTSAGGAVVVYSHRHGCLFRAAIRSIFSAPPTQATRNAARQKELHNTLHHPSACPGFRGQEAPASACTPASN
eukprot:6660247-Pyramimonas_sp.AAC.1